MDDDDAILIDKDKKDETRYITVAIHNNNG